MDIFDKIKNKYEEMGENPDTFIQGFLHEKPINYWDYIHVDTLLSLQQQRTDYKDEKIFVMYHQVIELFLKMLLHEVKQLQEDEKVDEAMWLKKLNRIDRYVEMLIGSFDIMRDGMDYDDFNVFRTTLAPASGFQSVQFRYIELYCTPVKNLVNEKGQERLPENPDLEDYFDNIYWKDAGLDRKTGKKTLTLRQFEERYEKELRRLAHEKKGKTLQEKFQSLKNPSQELKDAMLKFDNLYNVEWPLVHLETAAHYLDKKGETKAATGGSEWKKYLHPKFQQRKFFPELWPEK